MKVTRTHLVTVVSSFTLTLKQFIPPADLRCHERMKRDVLNSAVATPWETYRGRFHQNRPGVGEKSETTLKRLNGENLARDRIESVECHYLYILSTSI